MFIGDCRVGCQIASSPLGPRCFKCLMFSPSGGELLSLSSCCLLVT